MCSWWWMKHGGLWRVPWRWFTKEWKVRRKIGKLGWRKLLQGMWRAGCPLWFFVSSATSSANWNSHEVEMEIDERNGKPALQINLISTNKGTIGGGWLFVSTAISYFSPRNGSVLPRFFRLTEEENRNLLLQRGISSARYETRPITPPCIKCNSCLIMEIKS